VDRRDPLAADEVLVATLEGHLDGEVLLLELGHDATPGLVNPSEHRLCQLIDAAPKHRRDACCSWISLDDIARSNMRSALDGLLSGETGV
jgi:hypothetical protein